MHVRHFQSGNELTRRPLRRLTWWVVGIIVLDIVAGLAALCYNLFDISNLFTSIVAVFASAAYMTVVAVIMIVAKRIGWRHKR